MKPINTKKIIILALSVFGLFFLILPSGFKAYCCQPCPVDLEVWTLNSESIDENQKILATTEPENSTSTNTEPSENFDHCSLTAGSSWNGSHRVTLECDGNTYYLTSPY